MGCLPLHIKLDMMIDELVIIKEMLSDDCIRPKRKAELLEEYNILDKEVRGLYYDLFKVHKN
jgi:hypothetical protein